MRSRLTVRKYNNTQSNAFKTMGSNLSTKAFFLGTFFSLQILCGYISASQTGTDRFSWSYDNDYTSFSSFLPW